MTERAVITRLELHHEAAARAFEQDFDHAGEARIPAWFADRAWPHAERVRQVNAWERGELLRPGWTPCTTRFLQVGDDLVGVVNVRHEQSEQLRRFGGHIGYSVRPSARRRGHATHLLAAGLQVCRGLGIERALLTCNADNIGSIRAIERNGGMELDRYERDGGAVTVRFWVPTRR